MNMYMEQKFDDEHGVRWTTPHRHGAVAPPQHRGGVVRHMKRRCEIDTCSATFIFSGRHHCRRCGSTVCAAHFHRPYCLRCSTLAKVQREDV